MVFIIINTVIIIFIYLYCYCLLFINVPNISLMKMELILSLTLCCIQTNRISLLLSLTYPTIALLDLSYSQSHSPFSSNWVIPVSTVRHLYLSFYTFNFSTGTRPSPPPPPSHTSLRS